MKAILGAKSITPDGEKERRQENGNKRTPCIIQKHKWHQKEHTTPNPSSQVRFTRLDESKDSTFAINCGRLPAVS